jgi:Primase C terminal 1 (PriCT-1)
VVKEFSNLFRGSNLAHGTWEKTTGNMATELSSATEEDFKEHLEGKLGLGIVPVTENGTCYFGAIDVDIDTIDHKELFSRIRKRNLPLSVCRSKSGGAHLYVFFKNPHPSSAVQTLLKKWAGLLGFPTKTEIFPKQTKSTSSNIGNWINLPYFNAQNTVRYSVDDSGSLTIEDFIRNVQFYTGEEKIDESLSSNLIQIDMMPPCLKALTNEGLPPGTRNVGLFSYGVFYRKSSPNGWADKLRYHNQNFVSPPLSSREVEALIKSIGDRQYQYKCDEEPLCSHCDRKTCLSLPYGIGNKPWEDDNNFDEIVVSNLRKIMTDPPTYILEVNSKDLHLNSDQFRQFEKLRKRIFEVHDAITRPMKQAQWEQKVRELLASKTEIQAPDDASEVGAISSKIDDYLCLYERSKGREDLLRGLPIVEKDKILFQVGPLQKFLISQKVVIENKDLYAILHRRQCNYDMIKIKGKVIRAWSMPSKSINRQEEDYTEAKFEDEENSVI